MDEATMFREALLGAVDKGLLILGESSRHAIYYHVERSHQVRREEIPERLEAFNKALRGIFGEGAKIIEKIIARNLYSRLALRFEEHENWTIANYVDNAKKAIEQGRSMERSRQTRNFGINATPSANTSILFRTKCEGGLDGIGRMLGNDFSESARPLL